jgi:hypothetical protein
VPGWDRVPAAAALSGGDARAVASVPPPKAVRKPCLACLFLYTRDASTALEHDQRVRVAMGRQELVVDRCQLRSNPLLSNTHKYWPTVHVLKRSRSLSTYFHQKGTLP